jgi:hypothetical protein
LNFGLSHNEAFLFLNITPYPQPLGTPLYTPRNSGREGGGEGVNIRRSVRESRVSPGLSKIGGSRRLAMRQNFRSVTKRPLILFAAKDGKCPQITKRNVHQRKFEEFGFAHEKYRARQGELHGKNVKVCDVIGGHDDRPIEWKIFKAAHFEFHNR